MLLEHGADVDGVNELGWTSLHFAAYHDEVIVIETFVAYGADLHKPDNEGRTALDVARLRGNAASIQALLAHGAS